MPNILVDPDRIMMDCDNVIDHLKSCPDLLSETIEAHYYRGRARYDKGMKNNDESSISNALADFGRVAYDDNADHDIRAEAFHFSVLCWEALDSPDNAEKYRQQAKASGIINEPQPTDIGIIAVKAKNLKKRVFE